MAKLIAKTYGDALFDTALASNTVDEVSREAKAVLQIFEANPELMKLLQHPNIRREEKLQVIREIFEGRISGEMYGFLCVLTEKDRQAYIGEILDYFDGRVKEYRHIGVVQVTSARPVDQNQREKIEKKILATGHYRSLETQYSVDESLIGGLTIRIGDRVVDGTVRSRLDRLTRQLRETQTG